MGVTDISEAERAALERMAAAYDEFAEIGQAYAGVGMFDEAEVAHDRAMLVLRAYENEDPTAPSRPPCVCDLCLYAYAKGRT